MKASDALAKVWQPHPGQKEFLESSAQFRVLACGRRWGKTDACAASMYMRLFDRSPTKHVIIGPTQDQANLLFERLLSLLEATGKGALCKVRRRPYPHLQFGKHTVRARSGHLRRILRGNEATHIIIDEAAYVPESLITEIAMPMLATTDGHLTMISTPHGMNHFWRFFQFGQEGKHGFWSRRGPSSESPLVSKRFLDIQRELIPERVFRIEYEAEFADSEGRIFKTEAIESCLVTEMKHSFEEPVSVGVDFGRHRDYTVVAILSGTTQSCELRELHRFRGLRYSHQVDRIAEVLSRFNSPRVLCDSSGLGDPVYEALLEACPNAAVRGKPFTQQFKDDLINRLAWIIDCGRLAMLPHVELMRELSHFESVDEGGTERLKGVGDHDDTVIALALAAYQLPARYGAKPLIAAA